MLPVYRIARSGLGALAIVGLVTGAAWGLSESEDGPQGASPAETGVPAASAEAPEVFIVSRTLVRREARPERTTPPVGSSEARAVLNPNTGELISSPLPGMEAGSSLESLAAAVSTSARGLEQVRLPSGAMKVDLEGRFFTFSVARLAEDGTFRLGHLSPETVTEPVPEGADPAGGEE